MEAAEDLVAFTTSRSRESLETERMFQRAVLHAVLVIGEAASRTSDDARKRFPTIEWGKIVATRQILVHVYWGIDFDIIWKVATERAPELIQTIKPLLQSFGVFDK